jgi:hypothetical protein
VNSRPSLAAFARHVRTRFDGELPRGAEDERRDADHARRRWSKVLRAIYAAQRDVIAYVTLCEETGLSAQDCLAVATAPEAEALDWVDRGLALDKEHPHGSMAGHDLAKTRRELLTKLGRGSDALEEAWAEFREHPSKYTYEELMRSCPEPGAPDGMPRRWRGPAAPTSARSSGCCSRRRRSIGSSNGCARRRTPSSKA